MALDTRQGVHRLKRAFILAPNTFLDLVVYRTEAEPTTDTSRLIGPILDDNSLIFALLPPSLLSFATT